MGSLGSWDRGAGLVIDRSDLIWDDDTHDATEGRTGGWDARRREEIFFLFRSAGQGLRPNGGSIVMWEVITYAIMVGKLALASLSSMMHPCLVPDAFLAGSRRAAREFDFRILGVVKEFMGCVVAAPGR